MAKRITVRRKAKGKPEEASSPSPAPKRRKAVKRTTRERVRHVRVKGKGEWNILDTKRFELGDMVGKGGSAAVYRAFDKLLDMEVAVY